MDGTDPRIHELRSLLPRAMLADWVRLGSRLVRLLKDRRHGDAHDSILERLLESARASCARREQRARRELALDYPSDLPITERRADIVAALRAHPVVVIAGETGSGKTTQIPKMCVEAGLGVEAMIGCTQPRRVAALSISRRIAEELHVTWGREVGCKIRFDDRTGPETRIKLMTDGILLAEIQGDPLLAEYNALVLDEAHERSLNIDFLLGHLKGLLERRRDLKVVVTSATIDTGAFSKAFGGAPVVEVSGRTFPVEIRHASARNPASAEDEAYVDEAVDAAEQALVETGGDILVFMPTERDIRETCEQLGARLGAGVAVIPLYGRLSSGDQQRVFEPSGCPRVIVATNIAETSLTIPGIRGVIDTGLARIQRYNPRTRTRRLPIEAISQSSARQRSGRAGRLGPGLCIRLYSEEDFNARPPFTQPEIQRANLAEVILRMKAFRLGEIESFPFLSPPSPSSIQAGYELLHELGALDDARELTALGRELARLPIDPTLGRMLLDAEGGHARREVLIIASGLGIQDPRERPLDQKDAADAAHRRFLDPASDFLTLLNLWDAIHDSWEALRTQAQRRRFCRTHFLSYNRVREWQELHAQLEEVLGGPGRGTGSGRAGYEAIHRSILSGLLNQVGCRKERNVYQCPGNRLVTVFPGSVLHAKPEGPRPRARTAAVAPAAPRDAGQPEWVVAAEIVETSQRFARTLAGIEPGWVVSLAAHLTRTTFQNPHWSAPAGRVVAEEVIGLRGLELRRRTVAFGNVDARLATEIFIRSALVGEALHVAPAGPPAGSRPGRAQSGGRKPTSRELLDEVEAVEEVRVPVRHAFLEHNRGIRERIGHWRSRLRHHVGVDVDEALYRFYSRHLAGISSVHELDRCLREHPEPGFLCATQEDLTGGTDIRYDAAQFPDSIEVGGERVGLSYAYAPGEEHDGVTLKVPVALAGSIAASVLDWAVPGLRAEKVSEFFRALPKGLRKQLMPFPPKVEEILRDFRPSGPTLAGDLARFVERRYGVAIDLLGVETDSMPPHLRARFELVTSEHGRSLGVGRDLDRLCTDLGGTAGAQPDEDGPWRRAAATWERLALTDWTLGDLPAVVEVQKAPRVEAWLGLAEEDGLVHLRMFRSRELAAKAGLAGLRRLLDLVLAREWGWLQKDLRGLGRLQAAYAWSGTVEELESTAFEHLKAQVLPREPLPSPTAAAFRASVEGVRRQLPGLAAGLIEIVGRILEGRAAVARVCGGTRGASTATKPGKPRTLTSLQQLGDPVEAAEASPSEGFAKELDELLPRRFLSIIPHGRLRELPRYLRALQTRVERAQMNPAKDRERARVVAPYVEALRRLRGAPSRDPLEQERAGEFRWWVEEFKVSVFAQELGTAFPVSAKRLDEFLAALRR